MSALAVIPSWNSPALAVNTERAEAYARQSKAKNTLRGYKTGWRIFREWCDERGLSSMPSTPQTVSAFVAHLADTGKTPGTISQRLSAVAKAHQAGGFDNPASMKHITVCETIRGVRRVLGSKPTRKAPVLVEDLRRMLQALPASLIGARDRAVLLLGFAGAFRRSELVSLDAQDLKSTRDGLIVTLKRSKTDQEAEGTEIGIPCGSNLDTCPVRAIAAWFEASGITAGPLFRSVGKSGALKDARLSDYDIARIVKRYCGAVGLDAALYSGHSLRAGLATSAALAGVADRVIMSQTRHRSLAMLSVYVRPVGLFRDNAAARVGL